MHWPNTTCPPVLMGILEDRARFVAELLDCEADQAEVGVDPACELRKAAPALHVCTDREGRVVRDDRACWPWVRAQLLRQCRFADVEGHQCRSWQGVLIVNFAELCAAEANARSLERGERRALRYFCSTSLHGECSQRRARGEVENLSCGCDLHPEGSDAA